MLPNSGRGVSSRAVRFKSPGVAGDVLLLVVLIPIAAAAVAFLLAFPIIGIADILECEPSDRTIAWLAGAPAVAAIALVVRRKLFWTLTLDDNAVVLGRWLPRRIPYRRIRFLATGRLADPMFVVGARSSDLQPLAVSTGPLRTQRIFLTEHDAERCLRAMHQRAPNASAIDANGVTYGPRQGQGIHYAEFRAAETLLIRALSAFTIVAVGIGGVLVFALAPRHDSFGTLKGVDDAVQRWRAQYTLGGIVGAVPALGAYGVAMLRRARRVLRGEYEERNL